MKIKHTLASAKDKKPTITTNEIFKLCNNIKDDVIELNYGKFILKYKSSRDKKTWYCINDSKFLIKNNFILPSINNPKFYEVSFIQSNKMNLINEFQPIRDWAIERNLYVNGDQKTQALKLLEEVGELAKSILKKDQKELKDAIGDCVVVLVNLSVLSALDFEDCVNSAYEVIKNRKGKMFNGTFQKDS